MQLPTYHANQSSHHSIEHTPSKSKEPSSESPLNTSSSVSVVSPRRFMPYRSMRGSSATPLSVPTPSRQSPSSSSHIFRPTAVTIRTRILSPGRFLVRSPEPLALALPPSSSDVESQSRERPSSVQGSQVPLRRPVGGVLRRRPHIYIAHQDVQSPTADPSPSDGREDASSSSSSSVPVFGRSNEQETSRSRNVEGDAERTVIIPPFFDEEHEEEVRRVLSQHGIHAIPSSQAAATRLSRALLSSASAPNSRQVLQAALGAEPVVQQGERAGEGSSSTLSGPGAVSRTEAVVSNPSHDELDVEMDNDGVEADVRMEIDCTSPRATTPVEDVVDSTRSASPSETVTPPRVVISRNEDDRQNQESSPTTSRQSGTPQMVEQDIAGICFDPRGEYVYVATTNGIFEWKCKDTKKWSSSGAWA